MPVLVVDNDGFVVRIYVAALFENLVSLFGDALVKFFAVAVILVDVFALGVSVGKIFCGKQFDGFHSRLHTSGSVDSRSDFEDYVADSNLAVVESANLDDAFQPGVGIGVESLESVVSHHAVFAGHGHDVGCDADSHQVEQVVEVVTTVEPVALGKGLHKLKAHAAA